MVLLQQKQEHHSKLCFRKVLMEGNELNEIQRTQSSLCRSHQSIEPLIVDTSLASTSCYCWQALHVVRKCNSKTHTIAHWTLLCNIEEIIPITKLIPYWLPFNYSTLWTFSLLLKCCFLQYNCLLMSWCLLQLLQSLFGHITILYRFSLHFDVVFHALTQKLQMLCAWYILLFGVLTILTLAGLKIETWSAQSSEQAKVFLVY